MSASAVRSQYAPWLAVNLSLLLPGLGQCYSHRWNRGLIILLSFLVSLGRGLWSIFAAQGNTVIGFWQLGLALAIYLGSLWDAHQGLTVAHSANPSKDPWYSLFLSQLLPGLGHFYLDQPLLGGLFLLVGVGLAYWGNNYLPPVMPLAYGIWAVAGYHAYRSATRNRQSIQRQPALAAWIVAGLMVSRMLVGYTPVWINQTLEQCIVPSPSMEPTLQLNDRIFVSKAADYRPHTGDIVVFHVPAQAIADLNVEPDSLFVKRVIGLPGQQIQIIRGQVLVDRQLLPEPYVVKPADYDWGPARVPPDAYFVLGDNRPESADSHVWGFLSTSDLIGQAYKIYWPSERIQPLR
jgi:signal peptidase I